MPANTEIKRFSLLQPSTYLQLPESFYQKVAPEVFSKAQLYLTNHQLLGEMNLTSKDLNSLLGALRGESPYHYPTLAQAYAGHQFGQFTFLGDGRAHLIGEVKDAHQLAWDVHLKGSGATQFSRRGDGKAALGPMLREYIVSEALHALGIPTTRSLAIIETHQPVIRENVERGAILVRLATSHLRVGTFEWAASQKDENRIESLLNYAIHRHDPDLSTSPDAALLFLDRMIDRQARLVAQWMSIGFIHGVMNTDNMTISGQTIDYGPCAFMDVYDPGAVFSSIDRHGRYAFANQPPIALWNLTRLAETLLSRIHKQEDLATSRAEEALGKFGPLFEKNYLEFLASKLGFLTPPSQFSKLAIHLFELMRNHSWDYTQTFLELGKSENETQQEWQKQEWFNWKKQWAQEIHASGQSMTQAVQIMKNTNPLVIARNYWVQEAIDKAVTKNDLQPLNELVAVLQKPFQENDTTARYQELKPEHATYFKTFCGT